MGWRLQGGSGLVERLMNTAFYSIRMVAERTGLSPDLIRVWEKRYGAVQPVRTASNRRRYSEREVERLMLLGKAVAAGHSIGAIARLPDEQLRALVAAHGNGHGAERVSGCAPHCAFVEEALARVSRFDEPGLRQVLNRAVVTVGVQGFLCRIVAPLIEEVGEQWRSGMLLAAHEHFLSGVLRVWLGRMEGQVPAQAPRLVVATPAGQLHELGALLAGAAAAQMGWRPIQLGTNLPAAEIAGAALQSGARAVALSIVYPADDPHLPEELRRLREFLPATVAIVVGGRAAMAYRAVLEQIGASVHSDLRSFCDVLDRLRAPRQR